MIARLSHTAQVACPPELSGHEKTTVQSAWATHVVTNHGATSRICSFSGTVKLLLQI